MAGRNRISRSLVSRFQDRSCALGGSKIEVGRLNLFRPRATNWLIATGQHAPPIPAVQSRVLAAVPPDTANPNPVGTPGGVSGIWPTQIGNMLDLCGGARQVLAEALAAVRPNGKPR